jgi:hypothetical protein
VQLGDHHIHTSGDVIIQQMSSLDISATEDHPVSPAKPVFMVRFEQDYDSVGRDEILKDLKVKLNAKHRCVALAGIGGVG